MKANKGFFTPFMLKIILIFSVIMALPIILGLSNPMILLMIQGFFAITIFLFVKRYMGSGLVTYVISAVLIYIFVIRLWPLFAAGYMLYLVAIFSLSGTIIFGLQKF